MFERDLMFIKMARRGKQRAVMEAMCTLGVVDNVRRGPEGSLEVQWEDGDYGQVKEYILTAEGSLR